MAPKPIFHVVEVVSKRLTCGVGSAHRARARAALAQRSRLGARGSGGGRRRGAPRRHGARLEVRVQDEGLKRFRLPSTPEPPSLQERVNGTCAARGWGLCLIRSLMDEVDVAPGPHGMLVRMFASRGQV